MKKRFLAALTAILLLSASCSNGSGEAADPSEALTSPTGQTPTADLVAETEPEITDGLPEADYEGADITIWGDTAEYDVFYDADLTGDVVNEEAEKPEFEKKVKDTNDSDGKGYSDWQDMADHDIGDAVPFKLTATLADNVTDYKTYHITFTDEMEKGLTLNADSINVKVVKGDTVITGYALDKTDSDHGFTRKLTWKEQRELEAIEAALPRLEAEKAELEARMSSGTLPYAELQAASERVQSLIDEISQHEMRWLELSE